MKSRKQIEQAITNLRYYAQEVDKLCKEQLNADLIIITEQEPNKQAIKMRFECIAVASDHAHRIETYCEYIISNISMAERLDDKLLKPDEPEQQTEQAEQTPSDEPSYDEVEK